MATELILSSPYPFSERLLLFGGGGVGKTHAVLSIARRVPDAHFHVLDTDISAAYDRAIYLSFPEVEDRVTIYRLDEWEDFVAAVNAIVETGDHTKDWLVFDNITWSWETVQGWMSDQVHGEDVADFMRKVRKETINDENPIKAFNAQLTEGMSWPLVNKEYRRKVIRRLHKWTGNLILVAEAKAISKEEKDEELKDVFGFLGVYPSGQKQLHHVAASNIFLYKKDVTDWRAKSAKDRDRRLLDGEQVTDFAMDYLRDIAGWKTKPVRVDRAFGPRVREGE